jgi:hypothetical protein
LSMSISIPTKAGIQCLFRMFDGKTDYFPIFDNLNFEFAEGPLILRRINISVLDISAY